MVQTKFSTDFTTGNIPRQIITFTLPLYASNILQVLYTVADTIIVGHVFSAFAGIANKINSISYNLSQALNTAGASMVGQNIGAKKFDRVKQIMKMILVIALVISAIMVAAVVFFPKIVFGLFTNDPQILEIGYGYIPIAVIYFLGSAFRSPMTTLINGCGNYINLILHANFITNDFQKAIICNVVTSFS